jgi:hypothetical protein
MKELICSSAGDLRILFIFDPRRVAILLLGGDKTGHWRSCKGNSCRSPTRSIGSTWTSFGPKGASDANSKVR